MKSLTIILVLSCAAFSQTVPDANSAVPSTRKLPQHQEQIVVTGSYGVVPLEETDRSVSTVEVGQSPSSYRNWADVLQQDTSLDVQQRAPGTSADLSIRGSSFGETLILVNGLRLNDAQTGHNNLDIPFPFESVQRVEVLKGSGSTLYGSDAMGGAVNFITAVPERSEIRLGAGIGNFGTNQQNGALTLARRQFSEQLTFVRELSTGFIANRDYRNLAIASESYINTPIGRSDMLLAISDRPYGAQGFYGAYPSWERGKGWLAAWTQPIGTQTSADFAYRRHTDEFVLFRTRPSVYENNHIDESYQAALRRFEKIGESMRVYYGADGLRESIDSTNLGRRERDQGGLYASFDARALRRFSFNVGAREELYTAGRQVFSPSVSGAYWVNSKVKLRASASHAFRLPTYTDLYYSDPANIGNPNLKPESAWSFEGGVQVSLARGLTVEGDVFHRRDRNVIDYVRSGSSGPYTSENIDNLNFTGTEVTLRWELPRQQRVELNYTGMHGSAARLNGLQSKYAFNYPVHSGVATWWSRTPGGFDSRFRVAALQRFESGAYPLVEWTVGRQFRYAKPYLQLTNLTDTKYQEIPGVPLPGRGVIAGLEMRWRAN
ncbi:MAG TPA: TonB-dependent receptor [Candidatus Saccharimonadales bacterium]|nr:TonB-dependent receptor [Candidatus Saccharimonadales bacterium]